MVLSGRFNGIARAGLLLFGVPLGLAACATARNSGLEVNVNTPDSGLLPFPTLPLDRQGFLQSQNVTVLQCIEGFQRLYRFTRPVDVPGWYTVVNGQTDIQCPRPETAIRMAFLNQSNVVTAVCNYYRHVTVNGVPQLNAIGSSACQFGPPRRGW